MLVGKGNCRFPTQTATHFSSSSSFILFPLTSASESAGAENCLDANPDLSTLSSFSQFFPFPSPFLPIRRIQTCFAAVRKRDAEEKDRERERWLVWLLAHAMHSYNQHLPLPFSSFLPLSMEKRENLQRNSFFFHLSLSLFPFQIETDLVSRTFASLE